MSTYNTTVSIDVLRGKANTLNDIAGTYTRSITTLYQLTEELDRMWEGDASRAFRTRFNGQRELFDKGARTLRDYAQALRDIADAYARTESTAIDIING